MNSFLNNFLAMNTLTETVAVCESECTVCDYYKLLIDVECFITDYIREAKHKACKKIKNAIDSSIDSYKIKYYSDIIDARINATINMKLEEVRNNTIEVINGINSKYIKFESILNETKELITALDIAYNNSNIDINDLDIITNSNLLTSMELSVDSVTSYDLYQKYYNLEIGDFVKCATPVNDIINSVKGLIPKYREIINIQINLIDEINKVIDDKNICICDKLDKLKRYIKSYNELYTVVIDKFYKINKLIRNIIEGINKKKEDDTLERRDDLDGYSI